MGGGVTKDWPIYELVEPPSLRVCGTSDDHCAAYFGFGNLFELHNIWNKIFSFLMPTSLPLFILFSSFDAKYVLN